MSDEISDAKSFCKKLADEYWKYYYDNARNRLIVNDNYGRNKEFLAESIAESRCSQTPREISILAKEEMEK